MTVYYKTFTDCSYHEIGILAMFYSFGNAFLKPLVCSYADRHTNYKMCLKMAVGIDCLGTFFLTLVPFYPQLLFDEPHPRLMWCLVAVDSFIVHVSLGLVVTLSDVFVIQECLQSRFGEHFGHYRIYGVLGWALSSISVAMTEPYIQLPYLALPLLASGLALLVDSFLLTQMKEILLNRRLETNSSRCNSISGQPRKVGVNIKTAKASALPIAIPSNPAIILKDPAKSRERFVALASVVYSTVEPDRLRQARRSAISPNCPSSASSSCSAGLTSLGNTNYCEYFGPQLHHHNYHRHHDQPPPPLSSHKSQKMFDLSDTRGSDGRISFMTQLDLLVRLSRHDRHHFAKYLILFILIGASIQIHYVFYFQYFTEVLKARNLLALLFTLSATIQVSLNVGETVSLLWVARLVIDNLGRDISLMLALMMSGSRAFIIGYLLDDLGIWTIAVLEIQSGILWGISYTLMIESASSYLSILDRLLLVEPDDDDKGDNDTSSESGKAKFLARLEELKEIYSIESIRLAIRATVQGIFSGACEGIGYAIGPLLAGFWLSMRNESLQTLYRDMAYTHLSVLLVIVLLEFCLMRLLLGSRSKIDRLMIGGGGI